jgi:hypothetical protein
MRRLVVTLGLLAVALLALAPVALGFDGGEGTYGPASDKITTNAGFILIAFFPLLALVLTLAQMGLDRRKERRKKLQKSLSDEWHGGW